MEMFANKSLKLSRLIWLMFILEVTFLSAGLADKYSRYCHIMRTFTCDDETCISVARVCDGHWDCEKGEDEADCGRMTKTCQKRNLRLAEANGYTCRKECSVPSDCKAPNKTCVCDDECGLSCLNPASPCQEQPPRIRNSVEYHGQRRNFSNPITISKTGPFILGDVIKYQCKKGMQLVGPLPRCTGRKQWSSETPACRIPYNPSGSAGIKADSMKGYEIYFLFDISSSILKRPHELRVEFEFAKRLVERMKLFEGYVNFGIMVFASSNVTVLDITENLMFAPTPDRVIYMLDDSYQKAISHEYERETRSGTNTGYALQKLRATIAFAAKLMVANERKVFIFTDGRHSEGADPVIVRRRMQNEYGNSIEFFSVTACDLCDSASDQEELVGLASSPENYVYLEDFYHLSAYVDKVTDIKIDSAKCGQAGKVASIANRASTLRFRRSVNAEDAAEGAWPWQALISLRGGTSEQALRNENLLGGGSILNRQWILTAAATFKDGEKYPGWMDLFVISVGVLERPGSSHQPMLSTIQMYSMDEFIEHEEFDSTTTLNNIALIRVGAKYNSDMTKDMKNVDGIEYGYYVRPVCLPCKGTCISEKQLKPFVRDGMTMEEKCLEEEKLLLLTGAKVIATGYGHQDIIRDGFEMVRFNPPKKLQQALLRIASKHKCQSGMNVINDEAGEQIVRYSDKMICCESGDPNKNIDTCKGDNGGPVVREVRNRETGESCWTQIGITSFGFGCGRADIPGYYTNVARYVSWIDEKMQQRDAEP